VDFCATTRSYCATRFTQTDAAHVTRAGTHVARGSLVRSSLLLSDCARAQVKMVANSFSQLLEIHGRLDALFAEHQRALLRMDTELARAEAPVGGSVEIFLNAHRKMREYLILFKEEIPKLAGGCGPGKRRDLVVGFVDNFQASARSSRYSRAKDVVSATRRCDHRTGKKSSVCATMSAAKQRAPHTFGGIQGNWSSEQMIEDRRITEGRFAIAVCRTKPDRQIWKRWYFSDSGNDHRASRSGIRARS
jgi:hypothetical protein